LESRKVETREAAKKLNTSFSRSQKAQGIRESRATEIKIVSLPLGQFPALAVKTHFLGLDPAFRWRGAARIGASQQLHFQKSRIPNKE